MEKQLIINKTTDIKDRIVYINEKVKELTRYGRLQRKLEEADKREIDFLLADIKEALEKSLESWKVKTKK